MKVLAISPHPDDETLGCGGTLLRHRAEGDELHWIVATEAHGPQWSEALLAQKAKEVDRVGKAFGMSSVNKLGLSTTQLDVTPRADLIEMFRKAIEVVRPEVVYLVHIGDMHTDHHVIFSSTLSVLKTFYMKSLGVRRILSWETLSSTEAAPQNPMRAFIPTVFRDITPYLDRKIEIMGMYESEAQAEPLPRSASAIRALARYRGASIGVEYAEAFMLVREVE
jgi:N-acetylglucosamine malate deacetylase 1